MFYLDKYIKIPNKRVEDALFCLYPYFKDAKKELYLVGGCCRDMLLGKEPKDYDFTTNASPEEVKQILNINPRYGFIDTGLKHGTITVHDKLLNLFFEITTYRTDGVYEDHRHPNEVIFTSSLEEDLKRRDFTINSFAYNPLEKELVMLDESYLYDLELGIIRCVGNPNKRFEEDALRMLRAIRFAAQLGFTIEAETYQAIKNQVKLLENISKERIRDELTKILLSDNPQMLEFVALTRMEDYIGDFSHPYLFDMLTCEHQNPWHYADVFHHTMDVIKHLPKDFDLRWSALIHDMGKPEVKKQRPQGPIGHMVYYGHPDVSEKIADEITTILKFPNNSKEKIMKFVKYHDYPLDEVTNVKFKKMIIKIGQENFINFLKLREADAYAHRLLKSTQYVVDAPSIIKNRYMKIIMNKEPLLLKDLKINGDDLKELGLEGKQIGECLTYLLEKALAKPTINIKETLTNMAKTYILKMNREED